MIILWLTALSPEKAIGQLLHSSWSKAISQRLCDNVNPVDAPVNFASWNFLAIADQNPEPNRFDSINRNLSLVLCVDHPMSHHKTQPWKMPFPSLAAVWMLVLNLMASYHAHAATKHMCYGSHGCSLPLLDKVTALGRFRHQHNMLLVLVCQVNLWHHAMFVTSSSFHIISWRFVSNNIGVVSW